MTGGPRGSSPGVSAESAASRATEPGILHPGRSRQWFDYRRHVPDARLAIFVENFWTITWDLPPSEEFTANVLPYPSVNLTVTNTEADVTGLTRTRYDRHLIGRGYVVGARFRPGCFRPFLGSSVKVLTDTHRPIAAALGRRTEELERAIAGTDDLTERVLLLTDFLLVDVPEPDPMADSLALLIEQIAERPEIKRVSQVARLAGVSVRTLQRLFDDYVGAGPKWAIIRCRLQDAAVRAAQGDTPDWGVLAVDLGFADQSHLTRAFTRTIGVPPAEYAALQRAAAQPTE